MTPAVSPEIILNHCIVTMKTKTKDSPRKAKSIALLNRAVADELSAVHQYMYFHFHCDDQGYDLLANLFRRTAIEEMLHIEQLAERILFLKGEVEMRASTAVQKIHAVEKIQRLMKERKQIYDQVTDLVQRLKMG